MFGVSFQQPSSGCFNVLAPFGNLINPIGFMLLNNLSTFNFSGGVLQTLFFPEGGDNYKTSWVHVKVGVVMNHTLSSDCSLLGNHLSAYFIVLGTNREEIGWLCIL